MRQTLEHMVRSALVLLAVWVVLSPVRAAAQADPDLREIIPYLTLVVDTSASMERLPGCSCDTPGCEKCLPNCDLPNVAGVPPKGTNGRELKKNRWSVVLEALTGTFQNFQCEELARTALNGMTYDIGFSMPHYQPWDCTSQLPGTACAYGTAAVPTNATANEGNQQKNGIIDSYSSSIRFGLMSFDGFDTYVGAMPLVTQTDFESNLSFSNGVQGLWSYAGGHTFRYPGCDNDYMIDTGVRSAVADEGYMVSLNSCTGPLPKGTATCQSWCPTCPGDQAGISTAIQSALLKARPYGGTPIAAALDDLYYHLKTDLTDQFGSCRHRFALLMTDGLPDPDYRDFECDCGEPNQPACPGGAAPNTIYHCPYPLPEQVATDLVHGRGTDKAMLERLFVVGLNVGDDTRILGSLNKIAENGCTDATGCDFDHDGNTALFADDLPTFVANLDHVMKDLIHPVSRSVPAFASGTSTATASKQYQISTGFAVATKTNQPWTGVMERRTFGCTGSVLTEDDVTTATSFQDVLNNRGTPRHLMTVVPQSNIEGYVYSDVGAAPCGTSGCSMLELDNSSSSFITPAVLGVADNNAKNDVFNWMRGINGTVRVGARLGDIYHSSPVIVGAPQYDTSDEAFNRFRQRPDIATQPVTAYVGSNDGILHAFSVESYTQSVGGSISYVPGEEMWGFIPPVLLNNLNTSISQHQFMMDGTPVVKNVYFSKAAGVDATGYEYRTVLVTGMRSGGKAYIALDVTDPIHPTFLWQFSDPAMGLTFGQPAIGQATFQTDVSGTKVEKNGAIAVLSGGVGELGPSGITGDCTNGATNPTPRNGGTFYKTEVPQADKSIGSVNHRPDVRCWKDFGRALFFVDVETGKLIKKIHRDANGKFVFPSPLVSTPALFGADIGAQASRAFITDADGVIWRVDMSAHDQKNDVVFTPDGSHNPIDGWVARPFHDIFWGLTPTSGELTYEAPLLSVDDDGHVVVIVGTGDNNNFVKPTIENRVVSLRELSTAVPTAPSDYKASLNWELRVKSSGGLVPSELVTGSMGLFNGQLFLGTFIAVSGSNACDVGKGRIHALDYVEKDTTDTNTSGAPFTYGPLRIPAASLVADVTQTPVINVSATDAVSNFMVMGLGVTQRPTCSTVDTTNFNIAGETGNVMAGISNVAQPSIYLVAQASGDVTTSGLIQKRGSSALGSLQLQLKKAPSLSRVTSWATTVD